MQVWANALRMEQFRDVTMGRTQTRRNYLPGARQVGGSVVGCICLLTAAVVWRGYRWIAHLLVANRVGYASWRIKVSDRWESYLGRSPRPGSVWDLWRISRITAGHFWRASILLGGPPRQKASCGGRGGSEVWRLGVGRPICHGSAKWMGRIRGIHHGDGDKPVVEDGGTRRAKVSGSDDAKKSSERKPRECPCDLARMWWMSKSQRQTHKEGDIPWGEKVRYSRVIASSTTNIPFSDLFKPVL